MSGREISLDLTSYGQTGSFTNQGTVRALDGAGFGLNFVVTTAALEAMNLGSTPIRLMGTLDNTDDELTLNFPLHLDGGTIRGGVVNVAQGGSLEVTSNNGNRLEGLTWNGDWALSESSSKLRIKDVVLNGRATLSGYCSGLWFEGTQEFPSGEIVFDYAPEYWDPEAVYRPWMAMWGYGEQGSGTLTLGSEVVVRAGLS